MRKNILIIALLFGFSLQAFSQYNEARRIDSTRLDSLKRILPILKDEARVNALNEIAIRSLYFNSAVDLAREDSVRLYGSKAYEEASRLGYKTGIALALITLSGFETWMNHPITDTAGKLKDILRGIELAEQDKNDEVLGWGYFYLGNRTFLGNDSKKIKESTEKAINYFLKASDTLHAAEITTWVTSEYAGNGEYEKAYDYGKRTQYLLKRSNPYISNVWLDFLIQYALSDMASIYMAAGDYETAMVNLRDADQYGIDHKTDWSIIGNITDLFCEMKQYDSAYVYWNKWRNGKIYWSGSGLGYAAWANSVRGKIYLANKEYNKAIEIFRSCNDTLQKYQYLRKGYPPPMGYLFLLGKTYNEMKNYKTALAYTTKATRIAQNYNLRPEMMNCFELLASVYHQIGNNDSAYEYLVKFNKIRDSIQDKQFLLRIYNAKKDAEIQNKEARLFLLDKDNKLKTGQLRQESRLKNFSLLLLSAAVLIGIFVYRSISLKRKNEKLRLETQFTLQLLENEKKQAELQQRATELEMQALRAQMNPHFIFNCLSSINKFILKSDVDAASDYLTRFSRLIRSVLTNSQLSLIPLSDEIEMLRLYLDMERLRFSESFAYNIIYENSIEPETIYIPPMLLQPFCENAIWHGLMHKAGHGKLEIVMSLHDGNLQCVIADNGIGREKAAELKSTSKGKQKSFGLKITTERLALFNNEKAIQSFYNTEDILDGAGNIAGTKVTLTIRLKEGVKKVVNTS